jgi:hypothetical protein
MTDHDTVARLFAEAWYDDGVAPWAEENMEGTDMSPRAMAGRMSAS